MTEICNLCGRKVEKSSTTKDGMVLCEECEKIFCHKKEDKYSIKTPSQIKEYLNQYVVGQDEAKNVLSLAAYKHYLRITQPDDSEIKIRKANILLVGPSGSGKTLLARTLANALSVRFAEVDVQTLTSAGYKGADVSSMFTKLFVNIDDDNKRKEIKKAEKGIVFIDEFDKICQSDVGSQQRGHNRAVVQELLKIIEGTKVYVPMQGLHVSGNENEMAEIDTSNILFILAGAFVGINEIIEKRLSKKGSKHAIGFFPTDSNNKTDEEIDYVNELTIEDLEQFGVIPEILGRVPTQVMLNALEIEDFAKIITEPKNAIIKSYQLYYKHHNAELRFTKQAIYAIAKLALNSDVGARGIQRIIEKVLLKTSFEITDINGDKEVIVDEDCILRGKQPTIIINGSNLEIKVPKGTPYFLFHKDNPILEFEMDKDGKINKIKEVINKEHLPLGVREDKLLESFSYWWECRSIPNNRPNLLQILQNDSKLKLNSLKVASHGMNLSDHYWINYDFNQKYGKINFFENEFSNEAGNLLILGSGSKNDLVSPDWCTSGAIMKRWRREKGEVCLEKKKFSDDSYNELLNEFIVSKLCESLGFSYVPYFLTNDGIMCKTMVDMKNEYVSAYELMASCCKKDEESLLFWLRRACIQNRVPNFPKSITEIEIIDRLVARENRSFIDFGFIRDPDTLQWKGFAPIFGNGRCVFGDGKQVSSVLSGIKLDWITNRLPEEWDSSQFEKEMLLISDIRSDSKEIFDYVIGNYNLLADRDPLFDEICDEPIF